MVRGDLNIIVSTIQAWDKDSRLGQCIEQDTENLWCMSLECNIRVRKTTCGKGNAKSVGLKFEKLKLEIKHLTAGMSERHKKPGLQGQ